MSILAFMYAFELSVVAELWPWGTGYHGLESLTMYFLSSIAAAIAAPLLWMAWSKSIHVAAAGSLNLFVTYGGIGCFAAITLSQDPGNGKLATATAIFILSAICNLSIFLNTRKLPQVDPRPLPSLVRYSFMAFCAVLILVGGSLVMKMPNVIPWDITPEGSVVYGWIFLGASVYFAYAIRYPRWENAAGPLCGFLAYDIVLIIPFLMHFLEVKPEHRLGLVVYTTVVVYSGILAIYFLFVSRETRIFSGRQPATITEPI